jgi:NAD(P)-dependent dehydrogenase (short-subunit alcohol dehydrogenase family)
MADDFFLRNQSTVALITGGAQGLGLAIATRLAREGARGIVLSGRSLEKGERAAEGLQALGTECLFVQADVSVARGLSSARLGRPGALRPRQRLGKRCGRTRSRHAAGH